MKRFSETEKQTIWDMREAGVPVNASLGTSVAKTSRCESSSPLREGSARAPGSAPSCDSLAEREEISRGLAADDSIRSIADALGRSAFDGVW